MRWLGLFLVGVVVGAAGMLGLAWAVDAYEERTGTNVYPPTPRQWGD